MTDKKIITKWRNNKTGKKHFYIIDSKTDCWNWDSVNQSTGYGTIGKITAHRHFFIANGGIIEDGEHVDHLCNNRRCVNPKHLEAVSLKENVRRGNSAKLTMEEVKLILKLSKILKQYEIAELFDICPSNVSRIVCGNRWGD